MLGWFSGKSPGYFGDTAAVSVGQVVHPITQPGLQLVHLGWFGNHGVDLTFRDALQNAKKNGSLRFPQLCQQASPRLPFYFPTPGKYLRVLGQRLNRMS